MSRAPSISELIERLRDIRIQEAEVIELIEQAATNAREERAARAVAIPPPPALDGNGLPTVYQVGDRVRIINARAGQVPTGTVTRVTADRITIITDDGTRTWRARRNVARHR